MKYLYTILSFLFISLLAFGQEPATEIRAVWLTTNWKLDWPRNGKTVEEQKKEMLDILDELQKDNFNVILFQTRAQGKVFHKSMLEEASPYFNSSTGFDPLAFAIEAAHARGMECHAWITTFPVERAKVSRRGILLEKKPDFYKRIDKAWFLDPGRPETKDRLVLIAKEIVTKYDVDGLHLDYIRYPDNPNKFPDNDSYQVYGRGKNKSQWRRDNVNEIVFSIYDAVKAVKNWVQVSSSPVGKYKPISSRDSWTAYETVFQDAGYWMRMGKHDLVFPMMYSKDDHFYPHVDTWLETSNGRPVVPGLGIYKLEENEKDWKIKDISDQMKFTRTKDVRGQAYFRAGQILDNKKGVHDKIKKLYKFPAKLPALTWLSAEKPKEPLNFEVFKDENGMLVLQWDTPNIENKYTYNVYFSDNAKLDFDRAEGILAANLHRNFYTFPASVGEYGFYYFVTASDRYHNESNIAESVYFVHSEDIY